LMREVRARLAATQVEYISGKVFFTTCSDLNMLKKLKSAERLFLLIKKQFPLIISSVSKGKIFNEMQRLINEDPGSWLNAISIWKNLLELDAKKEKLSQRDDNQLKRKVGENEIIAKKLKIEQMQKIEENRDCQLEKQIKEETLEQRDFTTKSEKFQEEEFQNDIEKAIDTHNQNDLTFRVSCRCSGTIGKAFTAQVLYMGLSPGPRLQMHVRSQQCREERTPQTVVITRPHQLALTKFSDVKGHWSEYFINLKISQTLKGGRKSNWNCYYETLWMESRLEESTIRDLYTSK
ncbi:THUMPD2 isoform 6, partial [Pan troglodytes]